MKAVANASVREPISVIAALRRTGCVNGVATAFSDGTGAGGVTDFGRSLMEHIREADEDA